MHHTAADELATAVGRYALGAVSLGGTAEFTGLGRWTFEELLGDSKLDALYGPRTPLELSAAVATVRGLDRE